MASKHSESAAPAQTIARPPEGFRRVGSVANAPWFLLEKGNVLFGVLENMYERPDERTQSGKSNFFQVKLLQSAKVRSGRAENAKVTVAESGTVVNLNYGPKTKELAKLVPDVLKGAEFQVWAVCGDKFGISKGRTMWDLDVQVMQTKAVTVSAEDAPDFGDPDVDDSAEATG
jgi:hypothetical protein